MIDLNSFVLQLTPEELVVLDELQKILKEAKEAACTVSEKFVFRVGEEKLVAWKDEYNTEYVTRDGVWQARYLNQEYNVSCTVDEIFKLYKEEYLYNAHLVSEEDKQCRHSSEVAPYFKAFINKLQRQH